MFDSHIGGRISAWSHSTIKYIYGVYRKSIKNRYFHRDVIGIEDMNVDHISHGTMSFVDNRRSNIRAVTNSQNGMNGSIRSNNTSGITGVSWDKIVGKWRAYIRTSGKVKTLGFFDNIDFAIGARQQAEREYFGEYAFKG